MTQKEGLIAWLDDDHAMANLPKVVRIELRLLAGGIR